VTTTCRCGTVASTSFCSHSAHKSCFFFSHDGQKLRPRQENGHNTLIRHVGHQSLAKPCDTIPHLRNPAARARPRDAAGRGASGNARTRPAATPRGGSPRGGTGGTRAPAGGARRVRKPPRPAWAGGRGTGRRGREREAASAADEVPGVRAPRQSAPTPPGRARRPATPRASPRPPPAPAPACRRRRSCTRSAGRAPPARRSAVLRGARNRRLSRTRRKPMWVRRERSCHSPYAGPRQVRFSGCFSAELVRRAPAPW